VSVEIKEGDEIRYSLIGWCSQGKHDDCPRSYRPFYFEQRGKKNVLTYKDEVVVCSCTKRGCKCYNADKPKTKATTRRRKK
jgi:hypothetical protein